MSTSTDRAEGDDLARQRRKREARLLGQQVVEFPAMTLADVVADVLAEAETAPGMLDVPGYLAVQGYRRPTIDAVIGYLDRQQVADALRSRS